MTSQKSSAGGQSPGGPVWPPIVPGYSQLAQSYVQPIKKDKTLLFVGLGCGVTVVVMLACVAGLMIWGYFKAKSALESASQAFSGAAGSAGPRAGSGGLVCEQASACCRKVMRKLSNSTEFEKCDDFLDASAVVCQAQLAAFQVAATNLDLSCSAPLPADTVAPHGSASPTGSTAPQAPADLRPPAGTNNARPRTGMH